MRAGLDLGSRLPSSCLESAREQIVGTADAEAEHVERDAGGPAGKRERRVADLQADLAPCVLGADARVQVPVTQPPGTHRADRGRPHSALGAAAVTGTRPGTALSLRKHRRSTE
jgi:hypothetical protein